MFGLAIALRDDIDPWWSNGAAALVAIAMACATLGQRLRARLKASWRVIAIATAVGLLMVACTHLGFWLISRVVPAFEQQVAQLYTEVEQSSPGLAITAPLTVVVVFAEELVWRGVAIELLLARLSPPITAVVAVLLYALPQLIGGSWVLVGAALVVGTVFTVQRMRTRRLAAPFIAHAIWSVAIFNLAPLT